MSEGGIEIGFGDFVHVLVLVLVLDPLAHSRTRTRRRTSSTVRQCRVLRFRTACFQTARHAAPTELGISNGGRRFYNHVAPNGAIPLPLGYEGRPSLPVYSASWNSA